jgi:peptide/nickel transport system substrate-binding protein
MLKKISFILMCVGFVFLSTGLWAGGQQPPEPTTVEPTPTPTKFNEAPMLAAKVAAGDLPPVDERLPEIPSVAKPRMEIGQYGGTLHTFATDNFPGNDLQENMARGRFVCQVNEEDTTIVEGDLLEAWELADDAMSLTLYFRKGAKWSDGEPFAPDDVLFTFEDMYWDERVKYNNYWWPVKTIKKLDDYTLHFELSQPRPTIWNWVAGGIGGNWYFFYPKHYLQKWHIRYNTEAEKLAKEEGYATWPEALHHHFYWRPQKDLDLPTMQPWILKAFTTSYKLHERNPYYWRVDPAGNQLPYIDKIVTNIVDEETYQLKIISGEADVAYFKTSLTNYTLYKENLESGDYRVVPIPGGNGADVVLSINQNDPDPVMRKINQDLRFRQALSLAINREEINNVVYFGLAVPRQATVTPRVTYYKKEWAEAYAQYDPPQANRLLDEAGLDKRNKAGFRLRPEGKELQLLIEFTQRVPVEVLELVKEYWQDVGLKVLLKFEEPAFFNERTNSVNHGIIALPILGAELAAVDPHWCWGGDDYSWGHAWEVWRYANEDVKSGRKKLEDFEGGKLPGEEPPEEMKELLKAAEERNQYPVGSKGYLERSHKIYDFHAKNLYMIGTVGMAPLLYIAKNNVGNVPTASPPFMDGPLPLDYFGDQLFLKKK